MPSLHVALNGWFWDQPYTGSGQYLRQLVAALPLVDPNIQITLIVPSHIPMPTGLPNGAKAIQIKSGRGEIGKVLFEQSGFPSAAAKIKPSLIHVPYWGNPLDSAVPQVVTVHDVIPLSMAEYRGSVLSRLYFSLVTASAKGATHIITDSEFSRSEIIEKIKVAPDLVTAIPLAHDAAFHPRIGAERDPEIREKYNLPEEFTLYLGGFDVRKNLRALISAYTFVGPSLGTDIPLILAGREPKEWGSPRFPDLHADVAARPELDQYIRFIGEIDEADKPGLYRLAHVFVFPSRYEGFGLGALEAMAAGTPVVAANASSIPEVVGDGAYLVDPEDSRAMAGAIIATHIQNDLRESLRNLGLARSSNFSWLRTARETLAVYQQALG